MSVLFFVSTVLAALPVPIGNARIGQVIAPASFQELTCREPPSKMKICYDKLPDGATVQYVMRPRDSGLVLESFEVALAIDDELKDDPETAQMILFATQSQLVDLLLQLGYDLKRVDVAGGLELSHAEHRDITCSAAVNGATWVVSTRVESAGVTCRAR